jgi:hypothetical protein
MIIPADNISSRCTSCGGTIFTRGADTELSKIANTPRRNSETNSFQNRGAKFGSRINLSEKERRGGVLSYVGCASLTPEEIVYRNNGPGERNDRRRGLQTSAGYILACWHQLM